MKTFFIYMMTNRSRVVLYTGVTNSLERRLWFHRNKTTKSFTRTYKVDRLVYFERFNDARSAIAREKEIKGWRREKKNDLVRTQNPLWRDLSQELFEPSRVQKGSEGNAVIPSRADGEGPHARSRASEQDHASTPE